MQKILKLVKSNYGFYIDEQGELYELRDSRFHKINNAEIVSAMIVGWEFSKYSEGYVTSNFTSQILYYCGLN